MALNFAKYLPTATADPCGRVQYGIPNNNTEHQVISKGGLHAERTPVGVRALPLRRLRQPGDLRRQERADAQPHRPEQRGAFDGGRPQPGAVVLRQRAARHLNTTINDRPLPEYFTATDLGSKVYSPLPGLCRHQRQRQRFLRRQPAAPTRATSTPTAFQLADDVDIVKGNHQVSFGGNWIHTKIETLNNRPDQRRVHVQRPGRPACRWPTS